MDVRMVAEVDCAREPRVRIGEELLLRRAQRREAELVGIDVLPEVVGEPLPRCMALKGGKLRDHERKRGVAERLAPGVDQHPLERGIAVRIPRVRASLVPYHSRDVHLRDGMDHRVVERARSVAPRARIGVRAERIWADSDLLRVGLELDFLHPLPAREVDLLVCPRIQDPDTFLHVSRAVVVCRAHRGDVAPRLRAEPVVALRVPVFLHAGKRTRLADLDAVEESLVRVVYGVEVEHELVVRPSLGHIELESVPGYARRGESVELDAPAALPVRRVEIDGAPLGQRLRRGLRRRGVETLQPSTEDLVVCVAPRLDLRGRIVTRPEPVGRERRRDVRASGARVGALGDPRLDHRPAPARVHHADRDVLVERLAQLQAEEIADGAERGDRVVVVGGTPAGAARHVRARTVHGDRAASVVEAKAAVLPLLRKLRSVRQTEELVSALPDGEAHVALSGAYPDVSDENVTEAERPALLPAGSELHLERSAGLAGRELERPASVRPRDCRAAFAAERSRNRQRRLGVSRHAHGLPPLHDHPVPEYVVDRERRAGHSRRSAERDCNCNNMFLHIRISSDGFSPVSRAATASSAPASSS